MKLAILKRIVVLFPEILDIHWIHSYFNWLVSQHFARQMKRLRPL